MRRLAIGAAALFRDALVLLLLCATLHAQSISSVAPAEGTIGATLTIDGSGFGTGKPKAWLSLPGSKAKTPLKVQSFDDGEIVALLPKGKPGVYDVNVRPKGKGAVVAVAPAAFELRAPEPLAFDPPCALPLATVTLSGRFFGPKPGSVKVGGHKAKVLAWLPGATPQDDDAVQLALPKPLADGTWHAQLKTKVATVTSNVLLTQTAGGDCAPGVTSRPDDLWTPTPDFPDASKITLTPLSGAECEVDGAAGAVGAGLPVYVCSPNSANDAFTTAAPDGSFSAQLLALPGSWVIVKHDPTSGVQWLFDDPNDLLKTPTNAAPGVMLQVPFTDPPGAGLPFTVPGTTFPARVDFLLAGHESVTGDHVTLTGTITVYSPQDQTGIAPVFSIVLHRLADAQGRPRCKANQLDSTLMTPTGLPIEHWEGPPLAANALNCEPLAAAGPDTWTASFSGTIPLPPGLPDGTYAPWLSTFGVALDGPLPGERRETNHFTDNHELCFVPFTVGAPQPARLALTLLTDVPSADGSRGVVSSQDAADFGLTDRIATQAGTFIIPRTSRADGSPLVYSLEPYAPMVSQGERRMPDVPTHAFAFPSGSLTVTVTRPGGAQDVLGPQPFRCGRTRSPTTSSGVLLDNGGGELDGVLQLSTDSHAFDYAFPAYGDYVIDVVATIDDVHGNSYAGGGTYAVTVAEPLDIEPGILPMTPLTVGDLLAPSLMLLPGVPADISVQATLLPDSDPAQAIALSAQGTADRCGVFAPTSALAVTAAGELSVSTTARYTDADGVLWAGATRWGQVVAPASGALVAHGRRGVDDQPIGTALDDYATNLFPTDAHAQLPYHAGDTLWQGDSEAARIQITVEDTQGDVQAAMQGFVDAGKYASIGDHATPPPTFAERAAVGELPLCFSTAGGENAAEDPGDVVASGYAYAAIERPGERVREILSDDDCGTAYWRFGELYGLQPGLGVQGDLPNDFKFQFGGAVFRDDVHALREYASYASLWLHLPADDPAETYVWPPFQTGASTPFGGPLLLFKGQGVNGFVVPLAPRPGAVLETGQTLSFSAQIAPPLAEAVDVQIDGPGGFAATISGRADAVGFFHDAAQDVVLPAPGRYHLTVTTTLDATTSAGPPPDPPPTGSVLGAVDGGFDVYVVDPSAPLLPALLPPWSVVQGTGPAELRLSVPPVAAVNGGTLHWTIAMPGWLLQSGDTALVNGQATITYAPAALATDFPNLDLLGRASFTPGLADTVWVGALLEADDGGFYARSFTLQGADLFAR